MYHIVCNFCSTEFEGGNKRRKYCELCSEHKVWLRKNSGIRNTLEIGQKVQLSKRQWLSSNKAKKFYKNLGRSNSRNLKRYFKTDVGKEQIKRVAKQQSQIMKKKISTGQWTPNITNTWTHWDACINEGMIVYKFRSSWEACFWFSNKHLEYETIRVPSGTSWVICDFVDRKKRIVYEIKPKSRYRKEKHKMNAIISWCLSNDYKFIWINDNNILDYIDQSQFIGSNKKQLKKLLEGIGHGKN